MKLDCHLLRNAAFMVFVFFCVAMPAYSAAARETNSPFAIFVRSMASDESSLTLPKLAQVIDKLVVNHATPVVQKWQGFPVLVPKHARSEFKFGDGIGLTRVWLKKWNGITVVDLVLSLHPCTRMETIKRLLGYSWQPYPATDDPSLEYNLATDHGVGFAATVATRQNTLLAAGCVAQFTVRTPAGMGPRR